jgi:hypothetical protein
MSDEQYSELKDIIEGFHMLSSNEEGLVNPNELKEIMEIMNMNEKNPFLYNVILQLCSYSDINQKEIAPEDFISLLDKELSDTSSIEGLEKIFTALYTPNSNTFLLQNIPKIDKNLENDEKIQKIFTKPEIIGKEIDFNEFVDIMKKDGDNQNNMNMEKIYKKKKVKEEKRDNHYSNNRKNNNEEDYICYENENIFDNNNIKNDDEPKEQITPKKKYRHMRKKKIKDLDVEENQNNELDEINSSTYKSKRRINDNYNKDDYKESIDNSQYKDNNGDLKSSKRYQRRYRDIK